MQGRPDAHRVGEGVGAGRAARGHAGFEVVDEELERVQALPAAGRLGGRGFRPGMGPDEEDAVARGFADTEVHVGGAAREQRIDRVLVRRDGGGDRPVELGDRLEDDRFDDRVPVGEVRVDRGSCDADLAGDGAQGDGLVGAGAHDQGGGRADDLLPQEQALPAPVPRPGGGVLALVCALACALVGALVGGIAGGVVGSCGGLRHGRNFTGVSRSL